MGKINDFLWRLLRHQCKGAACEFQRVYIFAHRLQDVLQVTFTHRGIVGATDFGDTMRAWFALTLVHSNKGECSIAHHVVSLSLCISYGQKVPVIPQSTALLLSSPNYLPYR